MSKQEWKQVGTNVWKTDADSDGVYGRIFMDKASDGVEEFWGMTCVDRDIPCDPLETAEVHLSLEEAQDYVEKAFLPSPASGI